MIHVEFALPRRHPQLFIAKLPVIAALLIGRLALCIGHAQRAALAPDEIHERFLDEPRIVQPELAWAAVPNPEIKPNLLVVQAVEDDMVFSPRLVAPNGLLIASSQAAQERRKDMSEVS
jgi:hypothetical protein